MEQWKNMFKMEKMCKTVLDSAGDTAAKYYGHQFYFMLSPSAANEVEQRSESKAK